MKKNTRFFYCAYTSPQTGLQSHQLILSIDCVTVTVVDDHLHIFQIFEVPHDDKVRREFKMAPEREDHRPYL